MFKSFTKQSKNKKIDYYEGHNFMCKKFGRSCLCSEPFKTVQFIGIKNPYSRGILLEKKNYGSNIPQQTFSKAVDRRVKEKDSTRICRQTVE